MRLVACIAAGLSSIPILAAAQHVLLETAVDPDERNVLSARVEAAQKSAEDLVIAGAGESARWVGKAALTYVRQWPISLGSGRGLLLGLGADATLSAVPGAFESAYGTRWPLGFSAFASARLRAMEMGGQMKHAR